MWVLASMSEGVTDHRIVEAAPVPGHGQGDEGISATGGFVHRGLHRSMLVPPARLSKVAAEAIRMLDDVSVVSSPALTLQDRFARELPELALPWQAANVADPQLLLLNEPLAAELGIDPAWLRSPDGVRLLAATASRPARRRSPGLCRTSVRR